MQFASLEERVGEYDEALGMLPTGERFNGNGKMLSLRGDIRARQGRRDEARQVLATLEASRGNVTCRRPPWRWSTAGWARAS